jgi:lysophospholipase L1-like esterase
MKLIVSFFLFFCLIPGQAQKIIYSNDPLVELKKKWSACAALESPLTILHIGDSHLQPNNLSGITRYQLQKKLGNGGRGLIFPYSLAKTNGPKDFGFTSPTKWENAWIIKPPTFDIGLTGISIKSLSSSGSFKWKSGKDTLSYPATHGWISYIMSECKDCSVEINGRTKKYTNDTQDTIQFRINADSNIVRFHNGKLTLLDLAENTNQPGLVYHSTGVAGATFQTYVQNPWFKKELPYFHPDLVVVSLGTNESYKKWDESEFSLSVRNFIEIIELQVPLAKILLVLPNENYNQRDKQWVYNERLDKVRNVLIEIATEKNLLVYDQQLAMGGKGCMLEWEKLQLVNKDHVHFLKKGYQKQGMLLYQHLNDFLTAQ